VGASRKRAAVNPDKPFGFGEAATRDYPAPQLGSLLFDLTPPSKSLQLVSKSAMMIELPEELGVALKAQANAHGVSADGYAREVLERDLASSLASVSLSACALRSGATSSIEGPQYQVVRIVRSDEPLALL
jgi:plasmid stability protein